MDAFSFAASFVPLQVGDRGGFPDFVRLGAWAACDPEGRLVSSAGDPTLPAFLRSSAKPFQVMAFLRRGLPEKLGLGDHDVACACASHEAEDAHVASASRILAAAGLDPSDLRCGTHAAQSKALERKVALGEVTLSSLHNNCSGKHAAMLATCRHEGWPTPTYTEPDHPLQQENLRTLAAFAGLRHDEVRVAVDNCTVPTFALPLQSAALAFARLVAPRDVPDDLAAAATRAVAAMTSHPAMVGGSGRLDTALMQLTQGRVVVKTGANGYYAGAGREPGGSRVLGFALKLAGGESETQKAPCCVEALRAVGLLSPDEARSLLERHDKPQLNCRGAVVGGSTWVGPSR